MQLADVNQPLVNAVIKAESNGNPTVVSKAGAIGLMQLLPSTGRECAREIGLEEWKIDLFDPKTNIRLGTHYLAKMLRTFRGEVEIALAAYNWGPGNVRRALLKAGGAKSWLEIYDQAPRETRAYVKRVLKHYEKYSAGQEDPSLDQRRPAAAVGALAFAKMEAPKVMALMGSLKKKALLWLLPRSIAGWLNGKKTVLGLVQIALWVMIYALPVLAPEWQTAEIGKLAQEMLLSAGVDAAGALWLLLESGLGFVLVGLVHKLLKRFGWAKCAAPKTATLQIEFSREEWAEVIQRAIDDVAARAKAKLPQN